MMELGRAHCSLKFRRADYLAEELIRFEEYVILKEDVVNADDSLLTQNAVIQIVQAAPHFKADAEMRIVIEICACGDNPIDKTRAHQRDDGRHADACRRHRSRQAHAYRDLV